MELPMPREAINRVLAIGRHQGMPLTVTYANRHSLEIVDTINDFKDEASNDDSSYVDSEEDDESMISNSDDDVTNDSDSDSDPDDDNGFEGRELPYPQGDRPDRPLHEPDCVDVVPHGDCLDQEDADDEGSIHDGADDEIGRQAEQFSHRQESLDDSAVLEEQSADNSTTVLEEQVANDMEATENQGVHDGQEETEFDCFQDAEARGRNEATIPNAPQLRRQPRSTKRDDYVYSSFAVLLDQIMDRQCFLLSQLSAKAGLKMFGQKGATAMMKELGQLVLRDMIKDVLSREQKQKALRYLMFLKEKRCGHIKGRGCTDGRRGSIRRKRKCHHLQSVLKPCF
jgi:hypothetical protein